MQHTLYNPFLNYDFLAKKCFLTGIETTELNETVSVFPIWLLDEFEIAKLPFKLLDESYTTYGDLEIPCSNQIKKEITALQLEVSEAFSLGPKVVSELEDWKIFYWAGLIAYGLTYIEIKKGLLNQQRGEAFDLSPALVHKFKNLIYFLQGISRAIDTEDAKPFSLFLFNVEDDNLDPFEHRNEINTMTFSMRIRNAGMIICLQDNEASSVYHKEMLQKIIGKSVSEKQFQEINARIFYSSYLYNQIPEYDILEHDGKVFISQANIFSNKAPFDEWVNKTYAQVLEAFFKPWNLSLMDILKDPNNPISFLE